jgi:L-lactate dehydrogenase complex protein LldF
MEITAMHFRRKAAESLDDEKLQQALKKLQSKFVDSRATAIAELPNFTEIRDAAADIRERVINHLDGYLLRFEQEATARGAVVHWAEDIEDANRLVVEIARRHGVCKAVKSKSMVTEECGLNDYLASVGVEVLETDLGEYILQLAHEPPSHIVAPVVHKSKEQIADLFEKKHRRPRSTQIADMCREAREVLRPGFLSADMGISGANFIIAETGSVLIVTNEGNGRLVTTLPRVHVAITGIEKVVPTLEDATTLLRLLPRSATGQSITNYVSVLTGTRGKDDPDGPEHFHVILLDNGRSRLLGTELQPMLRCIRCGACMNHCPVYQNIGGHAYGWVYPGPMARC